MNGFPSRWVALAAALVIAGASVECATAQVIVDFSAIIYESPFSSGSLAVNQTITGQFTYNPAAKKPKRSGPNWADYRTPGMSVSAGPLTFLSTKGEISVGDDISGGFWNGIHYDHVDLFSVTGYALMGPSVDGYAPAFSDLYLIDTDNSVYTGPDLPIDLPDPSLFEVKEFRTVLHIVPGQRRDVLAQISAFSVVTIVPEPGWFALFSASLVSMAVGMRLRRRN